MINLLRHTNADLLWLSTVSISIYSECVYSGGCVDLAVYSECGYSGGCVDLAVKVNCGYTVYTDPARPIIKYVEQFDPTQLQQQSICFPSDYSVNHSKPVIIMEGTSVVENVSNCELVY